MEKLLKRGIVIFCLVFAFFSPVTLIQAQETGKAELTGFSGDVQVFLKGEEDYTDAAEGMELEAGDKIETGSGASAELSFNQANTNLVRLSEGTSVEVSLSGDEKLKMTEGEVFASISSLPSSSAFEITTPTAVSGARGTDWVTKITDEGTDVEAVEKEPYVRHYESPGKFSSQPVFITPGQMTTVKRFQKPLAFRPIQEKRRQQWQALKQDVRQRAGEAMQKRNQRPPFNRNEFLRDMRERKGGGGLKPLRSGEHPGLDRLQLRDGGKKNEFNAREEGVRRPRRGEEDKFYPQRDAVRNLKRIEADNLSQRISGMDDKSNISRPVFGQKKPEQNLQRAQGGLENLEKQQPRLGNQQPMQGNKPPKPKLNLQQRRPPPGARPKR